MSYMKSTKSQTKLLQKIKESLERLNEQMDVMIDLQKHNPNETEMMTDALDVMTLLSLPDHLRKTAVTLCKLGEATAEEIAEETERARAVESSYLNQLVLMGYLKKQRRGRKAYFCIEREGEGEKPWGK
ncbi:MAG: transcriptional regulator [Candidatus Bathyarchaeota archaeon]|nr:MAG: transcriptional regulator [Candidatus Bathyarchaeota archaeon]